jgi:hypothetical protein
MANQIILKRSSTPSKVPTTAQLALGELAINTYDGKIYVKKDNGVATVVEIGGVTSVNTLTGDVVLSTSDVAEGSNQYFTTSRARGAMSAGTGISYNSGTGVISTAQSITTSASPTFAGLTLTGNMGITGSIVPSSDIMYDLGSPTAQWKDIYVGPGSLYVNGSKVLQDDTGTITFSADQDQNIRIKTTGNGILQLGSSTTTLQVDSTMQITAGKRITSSDGVKVQFGDDLEMNSNKIIGVGAPSASTDAATKGYVDTAIGAVSTSSIAQGNSNISVVDTGTGTVTVTVDGSTALTVDASGVVVAGNFTVSGTTTSVNSNTISLADNIITLNSDATGAPTQNAGLEIERGDEANTQIRWNEGSDKWTFTNDGAVYHPVAVNTDDLAEGTSNIYFTQARARTSLSVSGGSGISYNSLTGVFNLSGIPNSSLTNSSVTIGSTSVNLGATAATVAGLTLTSPVINGATVGGHIVPTTDIVYDLGSETKRFRDLYLSGNTIKLGEATISAAGGGLSLGTGTVVTKDANSNFTAGTITAALAGNASTATALQTARTINGASFNGTANITFSTDATAEGSTNLYFTTARARGALSASGAGVSYNSTTGVISYVDPTTSNVSEGTRLYFTDARAIAANTSAIATAKSEAISAASSDATTKANAAKPVAGTGISVSGVTVTNTLSTSGGSIGGGISVSGAITATGEITAYYSDVNLKKDIVEITDPIAKVMALRGVTYRPNQTALDLGITDKEEVGVIAQEVEAVLPQLVCPSAFEGYKTVKYEKLTALLLEAVKAQQTQIEALTAQVAKLSGQ